jgi:hypothetical protein
VCLGGKKKIGRNLKYFRAEFKDDKKLYFKVVDSR